MPPPNPTRIAAVLALVLCGALLLAGCGTTVTVDLGTIRVTVTASGNNLDPDGYIIRVTGNGEDQSRPVDVNGEVLFAVPSGRYTVELTGKADNCIVDLNPQTVQVSGGRTSDLLFNTLCG